MQTNHYTIRNLEAYTTSKTKLLTYFENIESVFGVIEGVSGQVWEGDRIEIILQDNVGCSYEYKNKHIIRVGVEDEIIQKKDFPENLWGCLLHETLHAFACPIIFRSQGTNELDEYCYDKGLGEPFILSFQNLVYSRLNEEGILDKSIYDRFQAQLESELKEEALVLYRKYLEAFCLQRDLFARFINLLKSLDISIIAKKSFQQDFDKAISVLKSLQGHT